MAISTPAPAPATQERPHGGSRPVTVIEPPRPWVPLELRELWEQRDLVYFPRLAIPIATVLSVALDFALAFLVLVGLMVFYGVQPTSRAIWVLPLSLLAFVTALGAGIWFAALSVRYRDVRYVVPFLVQF